MLNQVPPTIFTGCKSLEFYTLGGHKEHSLGSHPTCNVLRFSAALQHIVRRLFRLAGLTVKFVALNNSGGFSIVVLLHQLNNLLGSWFNGSK